MDAIEFLRQVVPDLPNKVVAYKHKNGGWRHAVVATYEDMANRAAALAAGEVDAYFALGTLKQPKVYRDDGSYSVRTKDNIAAWQALWLDLDVKDKPGCYPTKMEALRALKEFVAACVLPKPLVVSSGYGLHVYWPLGRVVERQEWEQAAAALKSLTAHHKLLADPVRTADCASVLRVPGTLNFKDPMQPCRVEVLIEGSGVDPLPLVLSAAERLGITPRPPKDSALLSALMATYDNYPVGAEKVFAKCATMRYVRDNPNEVSEPLWYAALQLLRHTENGHALAHQISTGYEGYSADEVDRKMRALEAKGVGPTLCSRFSDLSEVCMGCPFAGRISSPVQLGKTLAAPDPDKHIFPPVPVADAELPAPADVSDEIEGPAIQPPDPYRRMNGRIIIETEEDGIVRFDALYNYDIYPLKRTFDELAGVESITVKHYLPRDGWKEFELKSSSLYDVKELSKTLALQGVYPSWANREAMGGYMIAYIQELQRHAAADAMLARLGWRDEDTRFVLGDLVYNADGSKSVGGLSRASRSSVTGLQAKGTFEAWRNCIDVYNQPGMEGHAFGFFTAFGAPLLHFTGQSGAIVSLVGEAGSGKTTVQWAVNSVWGVPTGADSLMMNLDTTLRMRTHRLSTMNNLPICLDEITNIPPMDLSDLCYSVSQGIGRGRLNADSTEQKRGGWQTIMLVSSNASLHSKLAVAKADAGAEAVRVFEYPMDNNGLITKSEADALFHPLKDNYGIAGHRFIAHIMPKLAEVRDTVRKLMQAFDRRAQVTSGERFWSAVVAANLAGAYYAKQAGLIDVDLTRMMDWCVRQVEAMRGVVTEAVQTPETILSRFIDEHLPNTLIVTSGKTMKQGAIVIQPPRGPLLIRHEIDNGHIYIERNALRAWMNKHNAEYTRIKGYFLGLNSLFPDYKKILGAGTDFAGGQSMCWRLDLKHPKLASVARTAADAPVDVKEIAP